MNTNFHRFSGHTAHLKRKLQRKRVNKRSFTQNNRNILYMNPGRLVKRTAAKITMKIKTSKEFFLCMFPKDCSSFKDCTDFLICLRANKFCCYFLTQILFVLTYFSDNFYSFFENDISIMKVGLQFFQFKDTNVRLCNFPLEYVLYKILSYPKINILSLQLRWSLICYR